MLIVALTGGIATGKSIVAQVLEELGCYIHRSDAVAHSFMVPQSPAWKKIVEHFGPVILNADKRINRSKLGEVVFSNPEERKFLNELLHPLVLKDRQDRITALSEQGQFNIFVSEAALTIEAGFVSAYDKVVVTHCPQTIQVDRLMKRDRVTRNAALKKIRSQMPQKEKLRYADYKIDTSGSLQETVERSEQVYRLLLWDSKLLKNSNLG